MTATLPATVVQITYSIMRMMQDYALVLEKAELSNAGGVIALPVVREVAAEDLLFIRDFSVTKPLSKEAFQQMMEPSIPESEK
jgi:hypothetical protein